MNRKQRRRKKRQQEKGGKKSLNPYFVVQSGLIDSSHKGGIDG
ncbi:MAG: hypothetical protein NTX82_01020 [Candidatus Parcubacteria bacterium]|nr:hypothetical protein [Candidatus Parcubacteria bacterium]